MNPAQHLQQDWHEKHMEIHQKFPEKFSPDVPGEENQATLPIYYGNVCLRFIPVFDVVVHRFLELPSKVSTSLETLMDHIGVLYKFHDRPITYLYNTLHYFEHRIRERHTLKKTLVSSIVGSLKDVRPAGWCLTADYQGLLERSPKDNEEWKP